MYFLSWLFRVLTCTMTQLPVDFCTGDWKHQMLKKIFVLASILVSSLIGYEYFCSSVYKHHNLCSKHFKIYKVISTIQYWKGTQCIVGFTFGNYWPLCIYVAVYICMYKYMWMCVQGESVHCDCLNWHC